MATRKASIPAKNHILAVSAKLLLAQGYRDTTIRQIASEADVSVSSIQNFFRSKEGIVTALAEIMFQGQFEAARNAAPTGLPPIYTYAVETAIQLTLTERNNNLREIYTEAYTLPETAEYIYQHTARELTAIFGDRFPGYTESDFYELEIGSAGLMRNYMAKPTDIHFSLHDKIARFLSSSLRIYKVSEEEIAEVLTYLDTLDIASAADRVVKQLFTLLEAHFSIQLTELALDA